MLARYTAWIWHLLGPLGIWGVFVVAFADSALLGMPIDAVVAAYVYNPDAASFRVAHNPPRMSNRPQGRSFGI